MAPPRVTEVTQERFEKLLRWVDVDDAGCWIWKGNCNRSGYGVVTIKGLAPVPQLVHRAVYLLTVGSIPEGLQLDHLCRVPPCCNPDHLEPVTSAENTRRGRVGELKRARIQARTHCMQGHPYSPDNVAVTPQGWRLCRKCRAANELRKRERKAS